MKTMKEAQSPECSGCELIEVIDFILETVNYYNKSDKPYTICEVMMEFDGCIAERIAIDIDSRRIDALI